MALLRPIASSLSSVQTAVRFSLVGLKQCQVFRGVQSSTPTLTVMRTFHSSIPASGFEEFYDPVGSEVTVTSGRAWTAADLRRKSFDDLHKLWYVLYKERNLLLSARARARKALNPVTPDEEKRYIQVKRSMAAIKRVVDERKKIDRMLKEKEEKSETM